MTEAAAPERWSPLERIFFRYFCAFFGLFYFPFPLTLIPKLGGKLQFLWAGAWNDSVIWIGAHVLHLAHGWLRILLRFQLAAAMIGYGFANVIKTQFLFPSPARLEEHVGDMSPMGLLWTFMGFSAAYTFFAGAGEVLGGALLYFRRTTTLGALIIIGVMSNVVMLNFSYDVPVKRYSAHLLLMAALPFAPLDVRGRAAQGVARLHSVLRPDPARARLPEAARRQSRPSAAQRHLGARGRRGERLAVEGHRHLLRVGPGREPLRREAALVHAGGRREDARVDIDAARDGANEP